MSLSDFDLTTEQGRNHAYLHSPEAADLVRHVEKGMVASMRIQQALDVLPDACIFKGRAEYLLNDLIDLLIDDLGEQHTVTMTALDLYAVLADASKKHEHDLEATQAILNLT